jgi:hypothetical protein
MRRLGTLSFWFQPTQDSDMGACQATGDRSERTILDNDFRSLTLASWTVLDGRCNYPSQFQQHRGNRNWVRFPSPAPDSKGSGPETWVTPRIALPSRIKVCCVALLLWLVCQIDPDRRGRPNQTTDGPCLCLSHPCRRSVSSPASPPVCFCRPVSS